MPDNNELGNFGLTELTNTKLQDGLASYVQNCYTEAKQHKRNNGIDEVLLRNLRAKKCKYQPDEEGLLGPYNDVYVGLCALKARAASSWLVDIVSNNIDKPWELNSTPEPELPERLMTQAVELLLAELPEINSFDALKDRAMQIKSAMQGYMQKEAADATKRMETRIDDQLKEGGWLDLYKAFVDDVTTYPTAFMRGPIETKIVNATWSGNKFVTKDGVAPRLRLISPFDAYPAPNASSVKDSRYFIEAKEWEASDVHGLIGVPTFLESNIRQALDRYKEGYTPNEMEKAEQKQLEDKDRGLVRKKGLEVVIYDGLIEGKFLIDHNVVVDDPQKFYEAQVWVIGDYTIRAVLNPNPVGERPIYSTSYVKINNDIWGQSVIDLVYDIMRVCNASVRALVRNMGYSSGPIGEVVSDRIDTTDDETAISPYKIFRVGPDITGAGAPAFRFHNVESVSSDLMAVFDRFNKMADDLSGVPAYVLGNPQVAGAGRTLGGLSMLMGNAAKGIKNVQLNIDRDIIARVISAMYYYNMSTSKDIGIKADAKVVARGATGLLQRELAQTRTVEVLQLLTPYVQNQYIDKTAIDYILRAILQNTGLPVDKFIPDPDAVSDVQDLRSLLGSTAETFDRGSSNAPTLPPQSVPQPNPNMAPYPKPVNLAQGA